MLTKLHIENIALVDEVELTFEPGLSVLTGETGAGKSVVVTALALAFGGRADKEYIRAGASRAVVTAELLVPPERAEEVGSLLGRAAERLVVRREIFPDGSSKAKLNGKNVSLSLLRQVIAGSAEILGQYANQMLMSEENHLLFVDRFGSLESQREEVESLFRCWQAAAAQLRAMRTKRDYLRQERELLLFQKEEIEKANLRLGEEEELMRERKVLDSARALMSSAEMVQQLLDAEETSVSQLLGLVHRELDRMAALDESLAPQVEELTDIELRLEELRRFVQQYGSSLHDDPQRVEEINERLDEIYRLKKKYGGSEKAVLATYEEIVKKLADNPDVDRTIEELTKEHDVYARRYAEKAVALSHARRKVAARLRKIVIDELAELAIENCDFDIAFLSEDTDNDGVEVEGQLVKPEPYGLETAKFLFSANPGAPLKSLVKTASGGEISRILLALKSAEQSRRLLSPSLVVFDEVDVGIGGRTAVEVGKKLKKLAEKCQVLVVTHLHQIARLADHHYMAEKTTDSRNRTRIIVRRLGRDDVPRELERMVALPESTGR